MHINRLIGRTLRKLGRGLGRLGDRLAPATAAPPSLRETRLQRWYAVNGDHTLRVEYDLEPSAVAFDLGGFRGDWAAEMHARYGCTVHVFEPCPPFCADIRKRLGKNPHIRIHEFGLGASECLLRLSICAEGSSVFRDAPNHCEIRVIRAQDFLAVQNITAIDVMKINIEGGEYELLEHLLETGLIRQIRNIQVQFHEDVIPDAAVRMRKIQAELARTHALTFQHEFIWENWQLRESAPSLEPGSVEGATKTEIHLS